jgi:hypothetical protein
MTEANPPSPEVDEAIRSRILERVTEINSKLLARLTTAAEDLNLGRFRAALGALDGIDKQIHNMRMLLLLASQRSF